MYMSFIFILSNRSSITELHLIPQRTFRLHPDCRARLHLFEESNFLSAVDRSRFPLALQCNRPEPDIYCWWRFPTTGMQRWRKSLRQAVGPTRCSKPKTDDVSRSLKEFSHVQWTENKLWSAINLFHCKHPNWLVDTSVDPSHRSKNK